MYSTPMVVNLAVLIGMIPVAVLLTWGLLRGLDKLSDRSVREDVAPQLHHTGTGLYYGLRFFGVCYLVAALASRFV